MDSESGDDTTQPAAAGQKTYTQLSQDEAAATVYQTPKKYH